MLILFLSSLISPPESSTPTEILGSANTISGTKKEITITQPQNYIQILTNNEETSNIPQPQSLNTPPHQSATQISSSTPKLIDNQTQTINPKDLNPLDYQDKIENTIYQLGDRLIIIQSIPLKYIKKALTPNIQPTITDYPTL